MSIGSGDLKIAGEDCSTNGPSTPILLCFGEVTPEGG